MSDKPATVYLSYDGMTEPLGQSQVIAYLEGLSRDYRIHLVSFEKERERNDPAKMAYVRDRLAKAGIAWTPLAYHKAPSAPATAYDITVGALVALWIAARSGAKIVHARSYPPALMALPAKYLTGARFLFDMRGLWADERVDGGIWPAGGALYRVTKSLERAFLRAADHVVTLTSASEREIAGFDYLQPNPPPIAVIPTCADLQLFSPRPRPGGPFTFGYLGSFGTWYLLDETMAFVRVLLTQQPDARMLVVNRNEHDAIRAAAARAGVPDDRIEIVAAEHRDVPALVARMDAAAALIKPVYSKIASAPTKLAEYLGCGVPCLGNAGVGDMEEILEGRQVGVILRDFAPQSLSAAAARLLELAKSPETRPRCVEAANAIFSLDEGARAYADIYRRLAEGRK
ncbi:MAG: glycosyltransferase [Rhodoblastus sp.]